MSIWANATVTEKGYALQAKLLSTNPLVITKVVAGSGRVPAGQLIAQTAVSEEKQTLSVEALSYDANGNAIIKVSLNNKNLTSGYTCNQVGIYASDPDEGEILYAISQEATSGEDIPSITEQPFGYFCSWVFSLTYSNSSNISVTIDPANVLTKGAADAFYSDINHKHDDTYAKETHIHWLEDIVSGEMNSAPFAMSYCLGGYYNTLSKHNTMCVGGRSNTLSDIYTMGVGGKENEASKEYAMFVGGKNNKVKASGSICVGGEGNTVENTGYPSNNNGDCFGGKNNTIDGEGSVCIGGEGNTVKTTCSFATGRENLIEEGDNVFVAGKENWTLGDNVFVAGIGNMAGDFQTVFGKYNENYAVISDADEQSANSSIFMIGYGTSTAAANAFRVSSAGKCYGASAFVGSGADFPEFEEWADGNPDNEDRRGLFVALDGDKIALASSEKDHIIGVVSAMGAFIANGASENWHGMYLKDVFGENLTQQVEIPEKTIEKKVIEKDEEGNEIEKTITKVIPAHTVTQFVVNPDYNPDEEYIGREFRKEWAPIGKLGQVIVVDDGTCTVGGYCKPSANGIGTAGEYGYYVRKRIDSTHIKVEISPGAFNK